MAVLKILVSVALVTCLARVTVLCVGAELGNFGTGTCQALAAVTRHWEGTGRVLTPVLSLDCLLFTFKPHRALYLVVADLATHEALILGAVSWRWSVTAFPWALCLLVDARQRLVLGLEFLDELVFSVQ